MDGLRELLERVRDHNLVAGHIRGLFHIAIGRRVTTPAGELVSAGATWRELASLLKLLRYDKDIVAEVGADPEELAPRDRQRYWYSAIALARPDSPEAVAAAEKLIPLLRPLGYVVGPPPDAVRPPKLADVTAPKAAKKKDAGPSSKRKK
jgi:hypothetical protein